MDEKFPRLRYYFLNVVNEKGDEKLVLHDKLCYDPKRSKLQMFPKLLRKPLFEVKVDRYLW